MKRILSLLAILAMTAALCACGGSAEPSGAPQPGSSDAAGIAGSTAEAAGILTGDEAEAADGLDDFGLPDVSSFTVEEIWDMYEHPENWDPAILAMFDDGFSVSYEDAGLEAPQVSVDPELGTEYRPGSGEWHDYDPGDWEPGPDETAAIEIDPSQMDDGHEEWSGASGEYPSDELPANRIPEEYSFLLPEGLKDGDTALEADGSFMMNLPGRGSADFDAIVGRAQAAGYTQDAEKTDIMGIKVYSASDGSSQINVVLQGGSLMVTVE